MPRYTQKMMCGECPFRADAPCGWLGPWTVGDIEDMINGDDNLICHTDVARFTDDTDSEDELDEEEIEEHGEHCVGMLRYMNSLLKLSRDPRKAKAQQALKAAKDRAVIPAGQFRDHHTLSKRTTK